LRADQVVAAGIGCYDAPDTSANVSVISDWRAEVATGDYRGRTCANALGFESADKRVLIIPSEPGI
ncbi:MAG: hypothetical protein ACR2L3_03905, partial [Actinomycetota bacterium]